MYTLQGVSKIYPNGCTALQAIDLHLAAGERVALIGPSGAGKTTLFRMLNCTLRPSSGTLTIGGVESTRLYGKRLRHLRCRIGTIYQQHNLVPRLMLRLHHQRRNHCVLRISFFDLRNFAQVHFQRAVRNQLNVVQPHHSLAVPIDR